MMIKSLFGLLWRAESHLELLQMDESDLKRIVGIVDGEVNKVL